MKRLRNWLAEKLATEDWVCEMHQAAQTAYHEGRADGLAEGRKLGRFEVYNAIKDNSDLQVIAEGHRANKTQKSQATADALLIGYDYALNAAKDIVRHNWPNLDDERVVV